MFTFVCLPTLDCLFTMGGRSVTQTHIQTHKHIDTQTIHSTSYLHSIQDGANKLGIRSGLWGR